MSSSSRVFNKIRKGSKSSKFIEGLIRDAEHGQAKTFSTVGSMKNSSIKLVKVCTSCGAKEEVAIEKEVAKHGEDAALTTIADVCPNCGKVKRSVLPA